MTARTPGPLVDPLQVRLGPRRAARPRQAAGALEVEDGQQVAADGLRGVEEMVGLGDRVADAVLGLGEVVGADLRARRPWPGRGSWRRSGRRSRCPRTPSCRRTSCPAAATLVQSIVPCQWLMSMPSVVFGAARRCRAAGSGSASAWAGGRRRGRRRGRGSGVLNSPERGIHVGHAVERLDALAVDRADPIPVLARERRSRHRSAPAAAGDAGRDGHLGIGLDEDLRRSPWWRRSSGGTRRRPRTS